MTIGAGALSPLRREVIIGALGVVYGDIGTSPIYTFRECLTSAGRFKYVCFVMRADNDGEGGIIALLGLAAAATDQRGR